MLIGMQIGALCALAAGLAGLILWRVLRKSATPEKREQRRRLAVHATGRIGDAMITEVTEDALFYTYSVRGVQYAASQDISSLRDRMPATPERLIGLAGIKYTARNPANSILICEEWSGFRRAPPQIVNSANVAVPDSVSSTVISTNDISSNDDAVGHQPQDAALAEGTER